MDYLAELGVGGVFALLIIREFVKAHTATKKKPLDDCVDTRLKEMQRKIDTLYEMHKVFDKDGAPLWYRKSSEYDTLNKIEHGVNNLRQAVQALAEAIKVLNQKVK